MKLAVVSNVLPPSWSGQAMVLYRILAEADPDRYCLISQQPPAEGNLPGVEEYRLPAKIHHLPSEFQLPTGQRFGVGRVTAALNLHLQTFQRARRIEDILQRESCEAVIACTGNLADPPAAYAAGRRIGIPFYLHVFDDYSYQWPLARMRAFAQRAERKFARRAAGFVVPNEFLGEAYAQRYGIKPVLVRNPSQATGKEDASGNPWPMRSNEIRIVYTGAVYHAHYDAFRNLVAALGAPDQAGSRLHIYTAQTRQMLEREGILGPARIEGHLKPSKARVVQQQADILFLPLAFKSPIPEVVRTSAPGKMGEYLASGRPVLAHAPADSFVSWFIKKHECGVVVDQDSHEALLGGIRQIMGDDRLRSRIVANARLVAEREFSLPVVRAAYWRLFENG